MSQQNMPYITHDVSDLQDFLLFRDKICKEMAQQGATPDQIRQKTAHLDPFVAIAQAQQSQQR